jgi:lipid-A-disaccharide synthase-like uncharacterized protein
MIGFLGQAVFTARFLAQWLVSERRGRSVVPLVFWWLSLAGGLLLLAYAASREDPVIMVGQSLGLFVYVRNLMLLLRHAEKETQASASKPRRRSNRAQPAQGHLSAAFSGTAIAPTLKQLRFDQDHSPLTLPHSPEPLFERLRMREDAL